jgi:hypothetical protein
LRQKELTLRLLNDQRAREQRIAAQVVSVVLPLLLLAIVGVTVVMARKRRYTK